MVEGQGDCLLGYQFLCGTWTLISGTPPCVASALEVAALGRMLQATDSLLPMEYIRRLTDKRPSHQLTHIDLQNHHGRTTTTLKADASFSGLVLAVSRLPICGHRI